MAQKKKTSRKHSSGHQDRGHHKGGQHKNAGGPASRLSVNLFGLHAIAAAWLNPDRQINALYGTENALRQLESLIAGEKTPDARPDPRIVQKHMLDEALPGGTVHQGLGADCKPLPECDIKDLIIKGESQERSVLLILDQITDPHNVGAILRSACAFGATGIIMQTRHAPNMTGILAKAASGALEHTPIAYETNLRRAIATLKEHHYFIYGLDEDGEQIGNILSSPPERVVLALGAEGPGLRELIKKNCDALVSLPTSGPVKALNVSNAAAVALYSLNTKT